MRYNLQDLVFSSIFRNKIFRWSEVLKLTEKLPTTHVRDLENSTNETSLPDPFYLLTQSAKNYDSNLLPVILKSYANKSEFHPSLSNYGATTKLQNHIAQPTWAYYQINQNWLYLILKLESKISWLGSLPGVKSVVLVGSTTMEMSNPNSDIDIAIQCYPGMVLLSRFWVKLTLKIWGNDVFPFGLGLRLFSEKLLSLNSIKTLEKIKQYKLRKDVKIDAGLFFESEEQLNKYFGKDIRQIWLWQGLQIWPKKSVTSFDLYTKIPDSKINILPWLPGIFLKIISILIYPLTLLQMPFYHLKNGDNKNRPVKFNFVSFYPLFHEDKFLSNEPLSL